MAEYFKCDGFDRDGYPCSSERVKLIEGPKGPRGPRGSAGKNYTTAHLSAVNTGGTILEVSAHGTGRAVEPLPREQRIYARRKFYFLYRRESGNVFYDVRCPYGASSFLEIADCEKRRSPSGNRPRLFGRKFLLFRLLDLHTERGRRPCSSALLARYRRLPAKGIGRLSRRRSARIKKSPSFLRTETFVGK